MFNLIDCEWKRIWSKKSTWLCFFISPIIIIIIGKRYLDVNKIMEITSAQFASFYNFPIIAIQKNLMITFNLMIIFLVVLSVTAEYKSGEMRMILTRSIKKKYIFIAKYIVVMSIMALFVLAYLIESYIIGYFMFPKIEDVAVFNHSNLFSGIECFKYILKYYFLSYVTLIAIGAVFFLIAYISKSVVIAIATSLGYLITSFIYSKVIELLAMYDYGPLILKKLQLLSLRHIQFKGIVLLLGENNFLNKYILTIIIIYLTVFFSMCYFIYKKENYLY